MTHQSKTHESKTPDGRRSTLTFTPDSEWFIPQPGSRAIVRGEGRVVVTADGCGEAVMTGRGEVTVDDRGEIVSWDLHSGGKQHFGEMRKPPPPARCTEFAERAALADVQEAINRLAHKDREILRVWMAGG